MLEGQGHNWSNVAVLLKAEKFFIAKWHNFVRALNTKCCQKIIILWAIKNPLPNLKK